MEGLIRSKIEELEFSFPEQIVEQKLAEAFLHAEDEILFDESAICREFDCIVVDERNPLEDRIASVGNLFMSEIQSAKYIEREYLQLVEAHRAKSQKGSHLRDECKQKEKENLTNQDLKLRLQDMNKLLQRQIKEVVEESKRLREMERARMEELADSFGTTIADISHKIAQQEEEQMKQAGDNQVLREKLAEFVGHSSLREQHFQSQLQAKDLELQLVEARRAQETELLKQEKARSEAYRSDISQLSSNKASLKEQIQLYSEKFDQFQDALSRSEAMFAQFEERISVMSALLAELQAKRTLLKQECSELDKELITEFDKRQGLQQANQRGRAVKEQAAQRCRQVQADRVSLLQRLQQLAPSP